MCAHHHYCAFIIQDFYLMCAHHYYRLGPLSYMCASLLLCIFHSSIWAFFCTSPLYFYLRIHFLMIRAFYYCASYSLLLRIHLSFNQGLFARPFLLLLRIHLFTSRALNHSLAFVPFFCVPSLSQPVRVCAFIFQVQSTFHLSYVHFAQLFSLMYL